MTTPTLTVIMPNFNHSTYLPESIEAILNQSFIDFELLISDDHSTDNSLEVIQNYAQSDSRISLFKHSTNQGPISAINTGIKKARGMYLAFCSADDILLPNFFSEVISFLNTHHEIGLCCTDPVYFDGTSPYQHQVKKLLLKTTPQIIHPNELVPLLRRTPLCIHSHGSIYRKTAVDQYGLMDSHLKWLCDWHFNHIIGLKHGIGYIPKPFASMRQLQTSYSQSCQKVNNSKLFDQLLRKHRKDFQQSAIFLHIGLPMIKFILTRPRYWSLLPAMIEKAFRMIAIKIFSKNKYYYEY